MLSSVDLTYLQQRKQELVLSCTLCKGSGAYCSCQEKFALEIKMAQANIPIKYRQLTLDHVTAPAIKPAKDIIISYIEGLAENRKKGNGLFLWSETKGTAKSTLACIILTEALRRGYSAYFSDLDECIRLTTGSWGNNDKRRTLEKHILETDFLVLDDVGGKEVKTRSSSDPEMRNPLIETVFTSLFKNRSDTLLPTIMTSNISPDDLAKSFGERLYSMTCEHLLSVECGGVDYRIEVLQKTKNNE
jgi:DNA replication protein DnaC